MAALNQTETAVLRDAQSIISYVLTNGYDPDDNKNGLIKQGLEKAKAEIGTVVQMKGYYPK